MAQDQPSLRSLVLMAVLLLRQVLPPTQDTTHLILLLLLTTTDLRQVPPLLRKDLASLLLQPAFLPRDSVLLLDLPLHLDRLPPDTILLLGPLHRDTILPPGPLPLQTVGILVSSGTNNSIIAADIPASSSTISRTMDMEEINTTLLLALLRGLLLMCKTMVLSFKVPTTGTLNLSSSTRNVTERRKPFALVSTILANETNSRAALTMLITCSASYAHILATGQRMLSCSQTIVRTHAADLRTRTSFKPCSG